MRPSRPSEATFTSRTSAFSARPKVSLRALLRAACAGMSGSSRFTTATASGDSSRNSSPSASATPSRLPSPSRCSGCTTVMRPAVGLHHARQPGNLPGPVHAHLDDGGHVLGLQPEERERHAHLVVEVALGLQRRPARGEDRAHHLLGRRLPVGATHRPHRKLEALRGEGAPARPARRACPPPRRAGSPAGSGGSVLSSCTTAAAAPPSPRPGPGRRARRTARPRSATKRQSCVSARVSVQTAV